MKNCANLFSKFQYNTDRVQSTKRNPMEMIILNAHTYPMDSLSNWKQLKINLTHWKSCSSRIGLGQHSGTKRLSWANNTTWSKIGRIKALKSTKTMCSSRQWKITVHWTWKNRKSGPNYGKVWTNSVSSHSMTQRLRILNTTAFRQSSLTISCRRQSKFSANLNWLCSMIQT